jgi:hypothetical protein
MRPVLRRLAVLALPALLLLLPASASAFPVTNCTIELTSVDGDGATIDTATVGDADGTQANPLLVDWDGSVDWAGTTGPLVIKDSRWSISLFYVPTPESGAEANENGHNDGDGSVRISEDLPFRVTGLYFVSGQISGTGGGCEGSGWINVTGDPFGTVPFWIGIGMIVVGVLLLGVGYRWAWGLAILGGLLVGLAATVMLIIYRVMPAGEWTPLAALLLGWFISFAVIFMRPEDA